MTSLLKSGFGFSLGCTLIGLLSGCPSQLATPPGEPIQTPIPQNKPAQGDSTVILKFPLPAGQTPKAMVITAAQSWTSDAAIGSGMADFADGSSAAASFNYPWSLAVNGSGEVLVADRFNHRIRRIKDTSVSTLVGQNEPGLTDGQGGQSRFNNPQGITLGPKGDLFVADTGSSALRQITSDGQVSTLLKDLSTPADSVVAANGDVIIADSGSNRILLWKASAKQMTVLAGKTTEDYKDGAASQAGFFSPRGVALTSSGNLFISDSLNHVIRQINPSGEVSTLAGSGKAGFSDGKGAGAAFNEPGQIVLDGNGNLLVVDVGNAKVRRITQAGEVTTLPLPDTIRHPQGIALNGEYLWISDSTLHKVYRLKPEAH